MISKIKEELIDKKGKTLHFKFNGSRNQTYEFDGYIDAIYNFIFTIKPLDNSKVLSFSYSDVLTLNLEIIDNE